MRKLSIIVIVAILITFVSSIIIWTILTDNQSALKHKTNRWAAIRDPQGDMIAVETTNDAVWQEIVELRQNHSRKWIGSIIVEYDNKWGFRLNPDNVTCAEVTAEGLQATIHYISMNLDYWLNSWAYINAEVIEIHEA